MSPPRILAAAIGVLALIAVPFAPGMAHHSFAMFDQSKAMTINGTVKDFQWTSPGNLTRLGWNRHSLNPGDKVAVEIAPLRDGSHGGGMRQVTLTDSGKVLTASFKDLDKPDPQ